MTNLPFDAAELLDPVERLAVTYASFSARPAWEALLFFQRRLAEAARPGREPLMIQLRLSWWRDRLSEPATAWPKGEPVLARLHAWEGETHALVGLVDGWEARIVGEDGGAELARAERAAYLALGRLVGEPNLAAVTSVATSFGDPAAPMPRLSKAMRPLSILHAIAAREARGGANAPMADFLTIVRIGLLGR